MNAALVHAVHVPIAFAWAAPRNVDMMIASELGTSSAPADALQAAEHDEEFGGRGDRA